jgi:NADH-quinone oxidoreductase subunit L
MVTAGVYMVARSYPIFSYGGGEVVASIGAFTALFAALLAITEKDIKRVLAYSTISQLGYMFMAVGLGATFVGIYHLFTHAFFKALLFLAAGSVMHALKGELDMHRMGGLMRKIPWTFAFFLIGALALAGIPPFAGYFSKDLILEEALQKGKDTIFWIGTVAVFFTSFYIFRLIFLVFFGEARDKELKKEAHEPSWVMRFPMLILAMGSILLGYITIGIFFHKEKVEVSSFYRLLPLFLSVLGILLTYTIYTRKTIMKSLLIRLAGPLYGILEGKLYIDEAYNILFAKSLGLLARILKVALERGIIEGVVNGIPRLLWLFGLPLNRWARGSVRSYALWILIGVILLTSYLLLGGVR